MTEVEPLKIIGVVTDRVGSPRDDGSSGSALYGVPIRLNRPPTSDEARLLPVTWDSPPQWTSMHRPGILTVEGDCLVLTRTTLEEIERYHAKTLALVVDNVNAAAAETRSRQAADEERAAQAEAAHRSHVSEVAARIKFD
ncbi:MAG TPA: hypothetical protein VNA20_03380 [Frankiaceae bacterium]|nr:hypothetical protein [Frankiaceae bacterium]